LIATKIQIARVIMGLYVNLAKRMEKDQATMDFGLRNNSSLDLLLRKKISSHISLDVLQMRQICFTHKKLMEFLVFQLQEEPD